MGSCTYLFPATWATAAAIMAGWSVLTLTILQPSGLGRRRRLAVEFGATAVLPATAPICLWSPATPLTQAVTGWAAKQSSACKLGQPGPVCPPTTGPQPTG